MPAPWRALGGLVRHTFTHFHLELTVFAAKVRLGDPRHGLWWPLDRIEEQALPTLYRKVIRHALAAR
jgi:A/G-specific adenine glycosylase